MQTVFPSIIYQIDRKSKGICEICRFCHQAVIFLCYPVRETDEKIAPPLEKTVDLWYNGSKDGKGGERMQKDRPRRLAALLAVCLLLLLCGCEERKTAPELTVLDVGEGSAALIRTEAGDVLIDAGPESEQDRLVAHLRGLGVERLELLILSHPDEDHIGGADGILRALEVGEILTNGEAAENDSYAALLRAADVPMRAVSAGERLTLGDAVLTVLSPTAEDMGGSENENSLVLLFEIADTRILLMGDAGQETERRLLADPAQLRADILVVGHHGANGSSSTEFLAAVAPRTAVISCGAGNSYGHPDGRLLARLGAVGAELRRTDTEGDVRIVLTE